jgi:diacylglycerol kinase (ATP)
LRRFVAILNPQADRGRTAQLAAGMRSAMASRLSLQILETAQPGEAKALAEKAGRDKVDAVIAVGGDGTVHEVVNGLMQVKPGSRPALGILPAGSGNDVAFALGIDKDLSRAAALYDHFDTRTVDIGEVHAIGGPGCYCINNVGLLLEGQINRASHQLRWPRGAGLYFRAMLESMMRPLPTAELTLRVDDGTELRRRAMIFSIANGPRSGGKFQLMPNAALDDGQFDYLLAPPVSRLKLLWNVRHALTGKELTGSWIERGRFNQLAIGSDRPIVAHVDGEPWIAVGDAVHELHVQVLPRALRVIARNP